MNNAFAEMQASVELALARSLPQCGRAGTQKLDQAIRYAVFPGGRRLRPMLSVLGAGVFTSPADRALPAACAVEFIHTSSLIFDDLPCMDDADLRRGKRSLHRTFGEDIALLGGIALLNQAYAIFGQNPALIREATECIGVKGMIGGQALDLLAAGTDDDFVAERNRKTSAMMRLSLTAGALGCGVQPQEVTPLATAGNYLGQAYQIADDLLDEVSPMGRAHEETEYRKLELLVESARDLLKTAYGHRRVAGLLSFIDAIFTTEGSGMQPRPMQRTAAGGI